VVSEPQYLLLKYISEHEGVNKSSLEKTHIQGLLWNAQKRRDEIDYFINMGFVEFVGDRQHDIKIGEPGSIELNAYEQAKNREKYITELQFEKLQSEVKDLDNRLSNFKPSNMRANVAIAVAIISAVLSAIAVILKLK
jgi:hypothetical protein